MNANQLRRDIVRPALRLIGLHSDAAENLVMGTAAVESGLEYVRQLENGPALGLFQMEPATYDDIWSNYLAYREQLSRDIRYAISTAVIRPPSDRMVWDLRLAAIMCRIHYLRQKPPLPDPSDVWAMAAYWKEHYNTPLGKGTEQKFVDKYALVS